MVTVVSIAWVTMVTIVWFTAVTVVTVVTMVTIARVIMVTMVTIARVTIVLTYRCVFRESYSVGGLSEGQAGEGPTLPNLDLGITWVRHKY